MSVPYPSALQVAIACCNAPGGCDCGRARGHAGFVREIRAADYDSAMPKDGPACAPRSPTAPSSPPAPRPPPPTTTAAPSSTSTLVYSGGRAALPEDIFDALEAKYGSGKVVTDRDALTPGMLQMRILP
jgi:hypothetical protein